MRTIKELLQLTLNKGNQVFEKGDSNYPYGYLGLCGLIQIMYINRIITSREWEIIYNFIQNNKPEDTQGLGGYYWPRGEWKPRQLWLKKQIKKI